MFEGHKETVALGMVDTLSNRLFISVNGVVNCLYIALDSNTKHRGSGWNTGMIGSNLLEGCGGVYAFEWQPDIRIIVLT